MADNSNFQHKGFDVNISYDPSTNRIKRRVLNSGTEVYQDELEFDKSSAAEFDVMSKEEQQKFISAWGGAGIKTKIEDGIFGEQDK